MTQTMFHKSPDAFVMEKVSENFEFLTGVRLPEPKGKSKNDDSVTQAQWFHALSFVHAMLFLNAVREAERRGLLNAVESALCAEVVAVLSEA